MGVKTLSRFRDRLPDRAPLPPRTVLDSAVNAGVAMLPTIEYSEATPDRPRLLNASRLPPSFSMVLAALVYDSATGLG